MFERRRQKILVALVLILLGLVVLDRLVVLPLGKRASEANRRLSWLTEKIKEARWAKLTGSLAQRRAETIRRRLRLVTEQEQNEFRRYLEAHVGADVVVTRSSQLTTTDMPEMPELKKTTFDLRLVGRQRDLRSVLENLDASSELLRIEKISITAPGPEAELSLSLEISTVGSAGGPAQASVGALSPPAGLEPPPPPGNIFLAGEPTATGPSVARVAEPLLPTDEFVLAGTVVSPQRRAALLEFTSSGRVRWVGLGERVGTMTIGNVTPDGVVFRLGNQQLALPVGRPGADLLAGRRVFGGGFELVGVCQGDDQGFALVRLGSAERARRVHLRDRLGPGLVVEISEEGIVLEVAGTRREVLVGGTFQQETQLP